MTRLPTPGSDNGAWGDILNDFLAQAHNADGALKTDSVGSAALANNTVTNTTIATSADIDQSKIHNLTTDLSAKAPLTSPTFTGTVTVPTPINATDATTKAYVDSTVTAGVPDSTTTTKGIIRLAGDLGGTATNPTVPGLASKADTTAMNSGLAGKENTITAGTTSQYYRGDKSWQTLPTSPVTSVNTQTGAVAVSYTHLTLPTKRIV